MKICNNCNTHVENNYSFCSNCGAQLPEPKRSKTPIIVISSAVFLILLISGVLIWFLTANTPYNRQLNLGYKYLNEGSYNEAILAFNKAIEIDSKKPDAYIGKATSYAGIIDNNTATNVTETLIAGYASSGSDKIIKAVITICNDLSRKGYKDIANQILTNAYEHFGNERLNPDTFELPEPSEPISPPAMVSDYKSSDYDEDYYMETANYSIEHYKNFGEPNIEGRLMIRNNETGSGAILSDDASPDYIANDRNIFYVGNYPNDYNQLYQYNFKTGESILVTSGYWLSLCDCLNDRYVLYESSTEGWPSLYIYDLETNTNHTIYEGGGMGRFFGNNILFIEYTGEYSPVNFYISDLFGTDVSTITDSLDPHHFDFFNNKIYYVEWINLSYSDFSGNGHNIAVKSCDVNGQNPTTHTELKVYGVKELTAEYVEYYSDSEYNTTKRHYF